MEVKKGREEERLAVLGYRNPALEPPHGGNDTNHQQPGMRCVQHEEGRCSAGAGRGLTTPGNQSQGPPALTSIGSKGKGILKFPRASLYYS
jgi:hypothetical protein